MVHVLIVLPGPDGEAANGDVRKRLVGLRRGGGPDVFAAEARQEREAAAAGNVLGRQHLMPGAVPSEPCVGEAEAGVRALEVVQVAVAAEFGTDADVIVAVVVSEGDGGAGALVDLVHLGAEGVVLVLCELAEPCDFGAAPTALRRGGFELAADGVAGGAARFEGAQRALQLQHLAGCVVGAGHDLLGHGLTFDAVRGEERTGSALLEDICHFPGEIVCVLDAGVGAEGVVGRVAVDGVAEADWSL